MIRGISSFSATFIILLGVVPIFTFFTSPSSAFVLLVSYLPVLLLWLVLHCKINRRHYNLDALVRKFLLGFVPGVFIALACEAILSLIFAFMFLGDQLPTILSQIQSYREKHPDLDAEQMIASINIKKTFGLFAFLFCLSFFVAGLVEECVKLIAGRNFNRCVGINNQARWNKNPIFVILSIICAALGFATAENIGYAFQSREFSNQMLTVSARSIIATPIHLICAGLTGVDLVKVDILKHGTVRRAVYPAILFHGIFDFQAFMLAILLAPKLSMAGFGLFSTIVSVVFVVIGCFLLHQRIKKLNLRSLLEQWDEQTLQSANGVQLEQKIPLMDTRDSLNEIV